MCIYGYSQKNPLEYCTTEQEMVHELRSEEACFLDRSTLKEYLCVKVLLFLVLN